MKHHIKAIIGIAVAGLASSFAAHAQPGGGAVFEGNFTDARGAPDWTISGSRYGSPRLPTMDGSGWLRLSGGNDSMLGQVEANTRLTSGGTIHVEFDYLTWAGSFDGLVIYFADASAPSAGRGGEVGGALGYCGMSGAYLGIGIDDGGSFAQQYCGIGRFTMPGPLQGTAITGRGVRGNAVTVRGPQSGRYPYVTSASLNDAQDICVACTDRAQATRGMRRVALDLTPRAPAGSGYTLKMTVNGREMLRDVDFPYAPPRELVMGLAATTGAYGAYHEIRNLKLSTQGGVTAVNCFVGVDPRTGKCLPANNVLKNWDVFADIENYSSYRASQPPTKLSDGDLAQTGWDGTSGWTAQEPKLDEASGKCLRLGTQTKTGLGARANQIVVVSRQDDWQHAVEPTPDMEFTKYGAVDFSVSYSTDPNVPNSWVTLTGEGDGFLRGNNKVMRVFDLGGTKEIKNVAVHVCRSPDGNSSPVTEILVWEKK